MARVVNGVKTKVANFDDFLVVDKYVVTNVFQPWRIKCSDGNFVASFAHGGYCLNVIPMAVGFKHAGNAQKLAQFEQLFVLVRRVDEHCFARSPAANNKNIVVVWANNNFVHLGVCVLPVQCVVCGHAEITSKPSDNATGI